MPLALSGAGTGREASLDSYPRRVRPAAAYLPGRQPPSVPRGAEPNRCPSPRCPLHSLPRSAARGPAPAAPLIGRHGAACGRGDRPFHGRCRPRIYFPPFLCCVLFSSSSLPSFFPSLSLCFFFFFPLSPFPYAAAVEGWRGRVRGDAAIYMWA